MSNQFHVPRFTFHGLGSFANLKEIRGTKAIIVTGKNSMQKAGYIDKAIGILKQNNIKTAVLRNVEPDPSIDTVMNAMQLFHREQPDIIIGLGGCSAIDAAKAMWIFYEHPETTFAEITVPFNVKPLRNKAIFVAIPSTSGTGTEVTCASVITDKKKGIKYPIVSYELTPDVAIVDGELCHYLPSHITANTGMDALCHNCETFVSTSSDRYTDPLAIESTKLIFAVLPKAFKNGDDLEARQTMHDAACLAGIAFTNSLLGIAHAMSHQLGGMFGIPHGRANAFLLPNVIRYNSKITNKYSLLARLFNKSDGYEFALEVEKLRDKLHIENSIKEYGINQSLWQEKLNTICANAMNDACVGCNPRKPTIDEIKRIYQACYNDEQVNF